MGFYRKKGLILGIIILLLIPFQIRVLAQESTSNLWTVYNNIQYSFSIDYPSDWTLEPRLARFENGGTLTFRSPNGTYTITLGKHDSHDKLEDETLFDWSVRDSETASELIHDARAVTYTNYAILKVNGADGAFIQGVSPLTEFQFTNIQKDDTIWFIWANMGATTDKDYLNIYDRMVGSFMFINRPDVLPLVGGERSGNSNWAIILGIILSAIGWMIGRKCIALNRPKSIPS